MATRKAAGHTRRLSSGYIGPRRSPLAGYAHSEGHRAQFLGYFLQETARLPVLDAKMTRASRGHRLPNHRRLRSGRAPAAQQSPQAASVQQPRAEQGQQWPTSDAWIRSLVLANKETIFNIRGRLLAGGGAGPTGASIPAQDSRRARAHALRPARRHPEPSQGPARPRAERHQTATVWRS